MEEKADIQIFKNIILMRNLMTKRNRARQGIVEEVVEGEQEGGQGGGLAPLAQQAAHHLQQVGQHCLKGCTGGLASLKHLATSRLLSWQITGPGARWCMALRHLHIGKLIVKKITTIGNTKSEDVEVGWGRSRSVSR